MNSLKKLQEFLANPINKIHKIVDFDIENDLLLPFDFTVNNTELTAEILADTTTFSNWVNDKLAKNNAKYGIGGYNEHRTIYSRSTHFDSDEEPRRLHLGTDIWGKAETPIYNFYDATVHSFKFNDNFGDYGATIILQYHLENLTLYVLYGHLSLGSLSGLIVGEFIPAGKQFATFGIAAENGHWPPHLHFQLMFDMQGKNGDYPGVCQFSRKEEYLENCPDPSLILKHTFSSAMPKF